MLCTYSAPAVLLWQIRGIGNYRFSSPAGEPCNSSRQQQQQQQQQQATVVLSIVLHMIMHTKYTSSVLATSLAVEIELTLQASTVQRFPLNRISQYRPLEAGTCC
jgi:hypothetical protein